MTDSLAQTLADVEQLESELASAAAHLRDCKDHLRSHEIPRYAAHLLATQGHVCNAQNLLNDLAKAHARRSQPQAIGQL